MPRLILSPTCISHVRGWTTTCSGSRRWARARGRLSFSAMIKLRNVEKSYRTGAGETFVLRRIDLDIRAGEFVTVMGPSGAGKSTLMAILGMLDGDWRGEYFLADQAVHPLKPKQRIELNKRYVGFVFQQYHL